MTRNIAISFGLACVFLGGCAEDTIHADDQAVTAQDDGGLGPVPRGVPAAHPIILAHGFDASPTNRWGFKGVAEALRADGHTVYVASVPPYQSPAVRATYLADHVDEALADGAEKVNIIAHSMGGIDSRYLISSLGYGDVVASLTTISSPHDGSNVADVALKALDAFSLDSDLLDGLAELWGMTYSELAEDTDVRAALEGISLAAAPAFNADNPDDGRVYYQSWAGVSSVAGWKNWQDRSACDDVILGDYKKADKMHPTLVPMAGITAHGWSLYPNDGMVRVANAKRGAFRGCIPADHLDQVGHDAEGPDRRTRFSHVRFYRNIAFELAELNF